VIESNAANTKRLELSTICELNEPSPSSFFNAGLSIIKSLYGCIPIEDAERLMASMILSKSSLGTFLSLNFFVAYRHFKSSINFICLYFKIMKQKYTYVVTFCNLVPENNGNIWVTK